MREPAATTLTVGEIRSLEQGSVRWLADARARLFHHERQPSAPRAEERADD